MTITQTITGGLAVLALSAGIASAQDLRGAVGPDGTTAAVSGWYLRADVGLDTPSARSPSQADLSGNGGGFVDTSMTRTGSLGLGVGYRVTSNLRVDATWELRTASTFKGVGAVSYANGLGQTVLDAHSLYNGNVESQVALVNAYYDIGTWRGVTPFVGVGAGVARNTVSGLTSADHAIVSFYSNAAPYGLLGQTTTTSGSYAKSNSRYGLAWALSAGLGWAITDRLTLEASWRYLNLGTTASSSLIHCTCGNVGQPLKLGTLDSHDLKVGVRWSLDEPRPTPPRPQPVIAKY